ncbi:MAG TPA: thymidine phosphorylase [Thermoanaerobaculia bacterium]|nr:thymidine phosphorylase [Thermoanaerobaculia bacterium]
MIPYRILDRKRAGERLDPDEIGAVVVGAAGGGWGDAELGAFLMAAAIRGLDEEETAALVVAMRDSGERWDLASRVPGVVDKHSTGGVGDKVSLILGPLLAACGVPVAMLTGRGLGHTGGTADKLESIPGLRLDLDRERCVALLEEVRLAIGVATAEVAPADRRLYALRDRTGTVRSVPLVVASILSKKLATGCAGIAFDVKCGSGAFFADREEARGLARRLVEVSGALGCPAGALLTDMSQPLGRWVGHAAEVGEALEVLSGGGEDRLREVTLELSLLAASLVDAPLDRPRLERALADGTARAAFLAWARAQGAEPGWVEAPALGLGELVVEVPARRGGVLVAVDTRELGLLVQQACRDRSGHVDQRVALRAERRIGEPVAAGEPLARLYLDAPDAALAAAVGACYEVGEAATPAPVVLERVR